MLVWKCWLNKPKYIKKRKVIEFLFNLLSQLSSVLERVRIAKAKKDVAPKTTRPKSTKDAWGEEKGNEAWKIYLYFKHDWK